MEFPRVKISIASEMYKAREDLRSGSIGYNEYNKQLEALLYAARTQKDYDYILNEIKDLEYKMITGYC